MHAKKNINGSLISLLILTSVTVHQIMVVLRKAIIFADQLMLLNLSYCMFGKLAEVMWM
jgi:hypothetical protein